MIPYTPVQLLFFFYVYCFCGWIIECTYVSVRTKKLTNRGFLIGPFIPIYGFGAMTLLLSCTPVKKYPVAVFFVGMFAASLLEFITGVLMEAIFKVRYWDYSGKKFNIMGHVCLLNSTYWGVIALILIYFFHRPIEALSVHMRYKELNLTVMCLTMYFLMDTTLSFKAAFDLRSVLIKVEKYKDEMRLMQKRLDVMLAYAGEGITERRDKIGDKLGDLSENVETKFGKVRAMLDDKPSEVADDIKKEYYELREKFSGFKANRFGISSVSDFHKRAMIQGNPEMSSPKYKDALEAVKRFVNEKREK